MMSQSTRFGAKIPQKIHRLHADWHAPHRSHPIAAVTSAQRSSLDQFLSLQFTCPFKVDEILFSIPIFYWVHYNSYFSGNFVLDSRDLGDSTPTICMRWSRKLHFCNNPQLGLSFEGGGVSERLITIMGGNEKEKEEAETVVAPPKGFRYNSPVTQVVLIGLVCFCCPGMFNALSGMGGGGQVNPEAANNANTALYTTFAVFGVLGGGIYNLFGPHVTLFAGCSTYVLYVGSFLYYNHFQHQLFAIIAGAILGIGAGLLWAGQGAIMTSYPPEDKKGRYISLFWSIFNLGGVIGGFIPFISNYHRDAGNVNDATYIAFMCFMALGTLLTLALLPSYKVVRNDGTRATLMKYSNPGTEGLEILKLFVNWKMLLLFPASWASNFFYTYQFNNVNGKLFTVRTKGFNNVFYWGAQMLGSVAIGYLLDNCSKSRKKRGYIGVVIVALFSTVVWGGGLANQLKYNGKKPDLDFKDSGSSYAGPFVLYFSYGLLDSIFQTLIYWMIGALADDSQTLSRYSGFYKGVQSAGAAVAWQADAHHTSPVAELIINWVLTTVSYPLLIILVALAIHDKPTSAADPEAIIDDCLGAAKDRPVQL